MGQSMFLLLAALAGVLVLGSWIRLGWRGALKTTLVLLACAGGVAIALSPNWMIYLSVVAVTVSLGAVLLQVWREAHSDVKEKRRRAAIREMNRAAYQQKIAQIDQANRRKRPLTAGEAAERLQGFRTRRGRP